MSRSIDKPLGESIAEYDTSMLSTAFYESADYKTLVDSMDKQFIVGRRGTGKSALVFKLETQWRQRPKHRLIRLTPQDYQVIGLRTNMSMFGTSYNHVRAGAKNAWKHALLCEMADHLVAYYKVKSRPVAERLRVLTGSWGNSGNVCSRLSRVLDAAVDPNLSPERRIATLPEILKTEKLQREVAAAVEESDVVLCVLLDSLDEGFEYDACGIGTIGGLVMAMRDLSLRIPRAVTVTFLRDAIYRALRREDRDFTRDIDPQVLHLHWNETELLGMITARLKQAFSPTLDTPLKLWNSSVATGLEGIDGFRRCLGLTLYRPRDLLDLLNDAFGKAARKNSKRIVLADIEDSAKAISDKRRLELVNEYADVIPGLSRYLDSLSDRTPRLTFGEACERIDTLFQDVHEPKVQQDLEALGDSCEIAKALYGTGVLGVYDEVLGTYIFSHDGKGNGKTFRNETQLLIHPSFWITLNLSDNPLRPEEAQEIHDEYDPKVNIESGEARQKNIGATVSQLSTIPLGKGGDERFEDWCLRAVKLTFAGCLRNCQLHDNKEAAARRDVIGRNEGAEYPWNMLLSESGVKQAVFEIKNIERLDVVDFRQLLAYLGNEYGSVGFFITRGQSIDLTRGSTELKQVREMYASHRKVVIVLTAAWFSKVLSKLRNPARHNYGNERLADVLDTYTRQYITGQGLPRPRRKRSTKK